MKWFGCSADSSGPKGCTFGMMSGATPSVNDFRHFAYNSVNQLIYFCDENPFAEDLVCYCSSRKNQSVNIWTGKSDDYHKTQMSIYDSLALTRPQIKQLSKDYKEGNTFSYA